MLQKKLNALVVEDSALDTELALQELQRAGFSVHARCVQDEAAFREALNFGSWDIILCDFALPSFSASSALSILAETHKDVPCIIVSGTIGEDVAVETLKRGAADYIMKDKLRRLPAAVEREIRDSEIRRARKSAELALRESKTYLEKAQEIGQIGSWMVSLEDNRTLFWSRETFRIFGIEQTEFHGTTDEFFNRLHPDDREMVLQVSQQVRSHGSPYSVEHRIIRGDGAVRWVRQRADILKDDDGKPNRLIGVIQDITEAHQSGYRIRQQAALLDITQDALLTYSLEGTISFWSKGAEKLFGYAAAEALDRSVTELILEPPAQPFNEARETVLKDGHWEGEMTYRTKNGTSVVTYSRWSVVKVTTEPDSILSVNTDLTERKRLEQQFLRAQRLESIGVLASGIAHDINNVLAPILMTLQLFRPKLPDPEDQELLDNLEASANRGAEIVRQVLTFASGLDSQRAPYQIRRLVLDVGKLIKETFPKNIIVEVKVPPELGTITCNPTQIYQALMNLCVNARDAMPYGGKLRLRAEQQPLGEEAPTLHPEAKPGPYIVLSIQDEGEGMSIEIQSKVFTPFFSTKAPGESSGLGLSTTLDIIRKHGGFIKLASQSGLGTEIKVYLPATQHISSPAKSSLAAPPRRGKGERILVVDDEATIRIVTKAALEDYGYEVLLAADGTEAIAVFARQKPQIDLVITDMLMPYLDGPSTIRALQKLEPDLRIIAVSGAMEQARASQLADLPRVRVLIKPFSTDKLLAAVGSLLETR